MFLDFGCTILTGVKFPTLLLYFDYLNSLLLICWTKIKLRGSENRASVEVKRAWKKGSDFT